MEKVLDSLGTVGAPQTVREIAERTGLYTQQVGLALRSLKKYGLAKQIEGGWVLVRGTRTRRTRTP